MTISEKVRCASCKKRTGSHEPDFVLENRTPGDRRYHHERHGKPTCAAAMEHSTIFFLAVRQVDAERNWGVA